MQTGLGPSSSRAPSGPGTSPSSGPGQPASLCLAALRPRGRKEAWADSPAQVSGPSGCFPGHSLSPAPLPLCPPSTPFQACTPAQAESAAHTGPTLSSSCSCLHASLRKVITQETEV